MILIEISVWRCECSDLRLKQISLQGQKMDSALELRSRAELCLRLLQFCTDGSWGGHLSLLAARYHEAALHEEYGVPDVVQDIEKNRAVH